MASVTDKSVEQLFTQIQKFGNDGNFAKALPLCIEILKRNPKDEDALRCKVICLMKTDKCKEAYHVMSTDKSLKDIPLWFDRAYCLYRQGKLEDALTELNKAEPSSKVDELLAQIYYKLENYDSAVSIYKTLVKSTVDANTNERETNLAAALASSAAFSSTPNKWPGLRESTYELSYNSACYCVATGDLIEANNKLNKARDLCSKEFEDDEADAKCELAPIEVMRGLCLQNEGLDKDAMEIYGTVLREKYGDSQTLAVAANNIICINKEQNMFDSKKKVKIATSAPKKLTKAQLLSIEFNSCLLSYHTNHMDQFKKKSAEMADEGVPMAHLLLASSYIRDKKLNEALKVLAVENTSNEQTLLAAAQILLKLGSFADAASTLIKIKSMANSPGMASLISVLYFLGLGPEKAAEFMDKSLKELAETCDPANLIKWTLICARFRLAHDMPKDAASSLETLLSKYPGNVKALALLIRSVSQFDVSRAYEVAKRLPEIEIPSDIDLEELEIGTGVTAARGLRKVINPEDAKLNEANRRFETKEKKRKKKKIRLPKVLVEGGADPERWIPRQERSYYRRKKRNRNEAIGKGSQGLSSANKSAEAALDMSKKVGKKSEPVVEEPVIQQQSGKQTANKPKGKPKKKGKGKW